MNYHKISHTHFYVEQIHKSKTVIIYKLQGVIKFHFLTQKMKRYVTFKFKSVRIKLKNKYTLV